MWQQKKLKGKVRKTEATRRWVQAQAQAVCASVDCQVRVRAGIYKYS